MVVQDVPILSTNNGVHAEGSKEDVVHLDEKILHKFETNWIYPTLCITAESCNCLDGAF